MAFEQFLSETYTRPGKARAFGYCASFAVHAPPLALFTFALLTQALVIGSSHAPAAPRRQPSLLRIPIALSEHAAAGGGRKGGGKETTAKAAAPRAGTAGALVGQRARRVVQP